MAEGSALATAFVRIRPKTDNFGKEAASQVNKASGPIAAVGEKHGKSFGQKFGKGAGGVFKSLGKTLSSPLSKGFAAFASFEAIKGFVEDAEQAERVTRLTAAVIKSTGNEAHVSAGHVEELGKKISEQTGVSHVAIQAGENLILRFKGISNEVGKGNKIFDRASQSAVDMAAAMHHGEVTTSGIASASKALGRALNDPIKGITALKKAGVTFTDQQKDQIKKLVESGHTLQAQKIILDQVGKSVGGAAKAGADPMKRLGVIIEDAGEDIGKQLLPYLDKAADYLSKNLPGAIAVAKTWFHTHLVPAMDGIKPVVTAILHAGSGLIKWFGDLPGPIQKVVGGLGAFFALKSKVPFLSTIDTALSNLISNAIQARTKVAAVGTAESGLSKAGGEMAAVGTAASTAAGEKGVGGFLGKVGKVAGVLGPLGLAVGVVTSVWSAFSDSNDDAASKVDVLTQALERDSGAIRDNTKAAIIKDLNDAKLPQLARQAGVSLTTATQAAFGNKSAIASLNTEYKSLTDRYTALVRARQKREPGSAPTQEENNLRAQAKAIGNVIKATTGENKALDDAHFRYRTNKTMLDAMKSATDNYKSAVTKARNAVLQNGQTLNTHTAAGKKNKTALDNLARAAVKMTNQNISEGKSTDTVRSKMKTARQQFIQTATQMGLSTTAAKKLADRLKLIPGHYKAKIDADTSPANKALDKFYQNWNGKKITVNVSSDGSVGFSGTDSKGHRHAFSARASAAGGPVKGPGGPTDDIIPYWLSNNEHIWTAAETKAVGGHKAMMRLRKLALAGGFGRAKGGPITLKTGADTTAATAGIEAYIKAQEKKIKDQATASLSGLAGFKGGGGSSANMALGRRMAAAIGWTGAQWYALRKLWIMESNWQTTIANGSSGAYGIPQSLPGSKMASAGADWRTNPATQIRWGLGYIKGRYGSPLGALAHEYSHHWYKKGTPWVPQDSIVGVHKGEAIVPREVNEARLKAGKSGTVRLHPDDLDALAKSLSGDVTLDGYKVGKVVAPHVDKAIGRRSNLMVRGN